MVPLAAGLALWTHPAPSLPATPSAPNSDIVQVTRVSPKPTAGSRVIMFLVEVSGTTQGGERTYHIPFMTAGQAKPSVGQLCTIRWVAGGKADGITGYGTTVIPLRVVTSFSCPA